MLLSGLLNKITELFQFKTRSITFSEFSDPLGGFSILYPNYWKYDSNIVIHEGSYSIIFQKSNELFTITTDHLSDFSNYESKIKDVLIGPNSGSFGSFKKKSESHELIIYESDYSFYSDSVFFGSIVLYCRKICYYYKKNGKYFILSLSMPKNDMTKFEFIFSKILASAVLNSELSLKRVDLIGKEI